RLRPRRVSVFQVSSAERGRKTAPDDLPASRADCQSLAGAAERGGAVSTLARRLSRAMPQSRAAAADAAPAQIRARRLQLPAPGPVRRSGVPAATERAA